MTYYLTYYFFYVGLLLSLRNVSVWFAVISPKHISLHRVSTQLNLVITSLVSVAWLGHHPVN